MREIDRERETKKPGVRHTIKRQEHSLIVVLKEDINVYHHFHCHVPLTHSLSPSLFRLSFCLEISDVSPASFQCPRISSASLPKVLSV